eukprot:Skav201047  [mRNA]  locus=scaffold3386:337903:338455:- [translate_table: standard]
MFGMTNADIIVQSYAIAMLAIASLLCHRDARAMQGSSEDRMSSRPLDSRGPQPEQSRVAAGAIHDRQLWKRERREAEEEAERT